MTDEFQKFEMTEEKIEQIKQGLMKDPDVISVEFINGEFVVETTKGRGSFKLDFKMEKVRGNV